jgi:hypothetical protein
MLKAVVSGDRAAIFANLHDYAMIRANEMDMDTPKINFTQFCNFMRPLVNRRISHVITLSREN